mgnify:FL=1
MIINMDFYVGKADGTCTVYYDPPEYENRFIFYHGFIEFDDVYVNDRHIKYKNINNVLFNIMLKTFKNYYMEVLI